MVSLSLDSIRLYCTVLYTCGSLLLFAIDSSTNPRNLGPGLWCLTTIHLAPLPSGYLNPAVRGLDLNDFEVILKCEKVM